MLNAKQLSVVVDYINANVGELHGIEEKQVLELTGPKITVEDVVDEKHRIDGPDIVVLVDRGIKGTSKYVIPVQKVEGFNAIGKKGKQKVASK
jgi:hypothetical protein